METDKNVKGQKVVWVSCRAEGVGLESGDKGCGGKEAVLMSAIKTGNQKAINMVRYRCTSCGRVWSVSY